MSGVFSQKRQPMNRTSHVNEEPTFDALGKQRGFTLRSPARRTEDPALVINLAMDRRTSLDEPPYCLMPDLFLAAWHRAASFDMPNHGENIDQYGEKLVGMAAAMAAGTDPFELVRA